MAQERIPMRITVESEIVSGGGSQTVRHTSRGCLKRAAGVSTLTYSEKEAGGDAVFTTLTFRSPARSLHLKRRGGVRCEILFDPHVPHTTCYEVPPYRFDLTVHSRIVEAEMDEHGGRVRLEYDREVGGETGRIRFSLSASPEEESV